MTAAAGQTAAYVQNPPSKPYPNFPALSFAWDGAATPTLTVKEVSDGTTCATYSGQALIQSGYPQVLTPAVNPWEVGPA